MEKSHPEKVCEMRKSDVSRREHLGLLRARPPLGPTVAAHGGPVKPSLTDEVRQLLDLVDRGLLSEEEFEAQMHRLFQLQPAT